MKKDSKAVISQNREFAVSLSKGELLIPDTPEQAFYEGHKLPETYKLYPVETRAWLVMEVTKLCKEKDMNKTLKSDEEIAFCCRAIYKEHPTMTLEEIRMAFDMIRMGKFGKMFERLQTAEILEALRTYEAEVRANMMEQRHERTKSQTQEFSDRKLEPLNLAALVKDSPVRKRKGSGTMLRERWDKTNKQ